MCVSGMDTWRNSRNVCLLPSGRNLQPEQKHTTILYFPMLKVEFPAKTYFL